MRSLKKRGLNRSWKLNSTEPSASAALSGQVNGNFLFYTEPATNFWVKILPLSQKLKLKINNFGQVPKLRWNSRYLSLRAFQFNCPFFEPKLQLFVFFFTPLQLFSHTFFLPNGSIQRRMQNLKHKKILSIHSRSLLTSYKWILTFRNIKLLKRSI